MNSTTQANLGKSQSAPVSIAHSPAPPAPVAGGSFETSRRPSPAGNTASYSAARKSQVVRKQHRDQRRPGQNRVDDDDAMAELRAVRNPSSRRGQTSITHLMNYSLPPPRFHQDHHNRSYRRSTTWGLGSGHHAIDKARYVHANYRFVVNPSGTYTAHAIDADKHLDWPDVLQVLASTESQASSCPICLSEPVSPRMAKCGHIFCLPCLLRFMSSGDEEGPGHEKRAKWKKCPICEDSVYITEVRPVRFYAGQESPLPQAGADVVLRLMLRNARSTLALPNEGGADVLNSGPDIPWHFAANVLDYARIMKGTGTYMLAEYDREIEDLLRQEKEDEMMFHEDNEWTQKAIKAVNASKEKIKDMGGVELALADGSAQSSALEAFRQTEQDFYFYSSPPHLYLSPLDIRILKTKYGSFSLFPSTLLPRVEHISTGHVVDDALRKRAKYLGHLPHGCVISFLECDWTDIVPAETLETFADEIERRRKRNRDKAAQEERERLQAERAEAAAIRGARRMAGVSDEEVTVRFSSAPPPDRVVDPNEFLPLGAASTTPPNPRPGFSQLAELSTSPSTSRTVWGTTAIAISPELVPRQLQTDVDDGWLKDDQFLDSASVAEITLQMEAMGVEMASPSPAPIPSGGGGGGKKKKKQKITLMSTGGRRGL